MYILTYLHTFYDELAFIPNYSWSEEEDPENFIAGRMHFMMLWQGTWCVQHCYEFSGPASKIGLMGRRRSFAPSPSEEILFCINSQ